MLQLGSRSVNHRPSLARIIGIGVLAFQILLTATGCGGNSQPARAPAGGDQACRCGHGSYGGHQSRRCRVDQWRGSHFPIPPLQPLVL